MGSARSLGASVIVPAYEAHETLPRCVEALLSQRFSGSYEVIVVASADDPDGLPRLPEHPLLRVERRVPRLPAAPARNVGASLARGRSLGFIDADALAPADWLERLWEASQERWCVAGAIANGTPGHPVGTAEYLVEFFDLSPWRPEPSAHGATCNLLVPRELWDAFGPFPEDLFGCEDTWLTSRLLAAGRLRFAADAAVLHLNRRRLRAVLAHQFALGAAHARLDAMEGRVPISPRRRAIRLTAGRVVYLYRVLARWAPPEFPRGLAQFPLVLAVFCAWGAGWACESRRILGRRRPS